MGGSRPAGNVCSVSAATAAILLPLHQTELLNALLTTSPSGVALFDTEGRFLLLNERLAAATGCPIAEHLGRTPGEVRREWGPALEECVRRAARRAEPQLRVEVGSPAGRAFLLDCHPVAGGGAGEPAAVLAYLTETGRAAPAGDGARLLEAERLAREEAERATRRLERLQAVTARLSHANSPAEVVEALLHEGLDALGVAAGGVVQLTEDGREFVLVGSRGYSAELTTRFRRYPADAPVPVSDVLRTGEPVYLESPAEWHARYSIAPAPQSGSWAVLPLRMADRLFGCFNLTFPHPRAFSAADRDFMLALAREGAQALERARLYEAERRARSLAEGASEAKSRFLAVMSHELRTPLNAILGYEDLLESEIPGPLTERQRNYLHRVRTCSWYLLDLINEILSLARIEAGKEELRLEPVNLVALAREAAVVLEPRAGRKRLDLRLELPSAPLVTVTDPGKLRQVLLNLLSNAVKFTDQGEVTVQVSQRPGWVDVEVRDTGIGIAPEHQESVFDPFTQVDQSTTRAEGGTGLGLAVSRGLVRLLGGELRLRSAPGSGSRFTVELPLRGREVLASV